MEPQLPPRAKQEWEGGGGAGGASFLSAALLGEQSVSKWQRLDDAPGGLQVKKAEGDQPSFDYFAAARAAALRSAATDDRASLIPTIPGVEIEAYMAPRPKSAFELARQQPPPVLSLGDEWLDAPLRGGLGEGITELVGEAACGKTQLAMQLLLQCQLPVSEGGLAGGSLFLACEGDFPINRLRSLADAFKRRHPKIKHDMLNRIFIKPVASPAELWNVLHHSLRPTLENGDVKLIVMDSVAAMFRTEHDGNKELDFGERSQDLLRMAAQLKQYSATYHIPVLVINQVSDFFAGADANNGDALRIDQVKHSYLHHWSMMSSGRRVVPALGLTWANCVNTRIFLTRKHEFVTAEPLMQRSLPHMQPQQPLTSIDTHGVTPLCNMFTPHGAPPSSMRTTPSQQGPPSSMSSMFDGGGPPPATQMRRFLHVQFSSHLPQSTAEFMIETGGVRGTSTLPEQALMMSPPSPPLQLPNSRSGEPVPTSMPFSHLRAYAPLAPFQPTPSAPVVASSSYLKNMYTPSGGARSTSYFDDDTTSADQDEQEAEALAAAEAQMMRARDAQHVRTMVTRAPILDAMAVVTSPTIAQQAITPGVGSQQPSYRQSPRPGPFTPA